MEEEAWLCTQVLNRNQNTFKLENLLPSPLGGSNKCNLKKHYMNEGIIFVEISKGKMTQSLISVKYLFWRFVGKVERKKIGEPGP